MRRKIRWHKLQKMKEKMMNAQLKKEILRINEYLEKDLKTKTSSETKMSHDFKFDHLYMFAGETCEEGKFVDIVIKEEEDKKNLNFIMKEDEIDRYHVNACTQLGKGFIF